ncbi:restriction endonuclease subunit S [Methanobrevibacter sp.]|uniref:restriction endonuclease subunit S n=1 Tax=Methanobrevibacter sp. TaxID=66852 RepID=UPI0038662731
MSLDKSQEFTEDWEWVKAKDFMLFNPRESVKKGTIVKNVPMDKIEPKTKEIPSFEITEYNGGVKFRNGDTLMARITPCLENGKISQVSILDNNEVGAGSTEFIVLREKEGVSDKDFIYYLSNSEYFKEPAIKSMVGSSGRQRVQRDVVENLDIFVPPLDTQKKIGKLLSLFDKKITLNKEINNHLEEQLGLIFNDWFIKCTPFNKEELIKTEWGIIPKSWKNIELGELIEITSGDRPNEKSENETSDFNIPLFGASKIMGYTKEATYNEDILIIGRVGTHGIVQRVNYPCFPSDNTFVIKSNYYGFIYQILKRIDYDSLNTGSTQPLITQKSLKTVNIILPNKQTLINFEKISKVFFEEIQLNNEEIGILIRLRDTLLPKLMSGEIDVSKVNCEFDNSISGVC